MEIMEYRNVRNKLYWSRMNQYFKEPKYMYFLYVDPALISVNPH